MKKKLEAELISIAHRILKLKNRAELDQLQQETLKLYEKISVLRFVEDNFSDVKPTIGHASAEEALEEIYGLEEEPKVHANEVEAAEAKSKEEKEKHKAESPLTPEGGTEVQEAEGKSEEVKVEPVAEEPKTQNPKPETSKEEVKSEEPVVEESKAEEPVAIPELETPAEVLEEREEAVAAVFEEEEESTIEEEEKATDAEVETIAPDPDTKVEDSGLSFKLAFEEEAKPEEPVKQKEITFEDYKDYVEPEFVKKEDSSSKKAEAPKEKEPAIAEEPVKEEAKESEYRDWRDWEPSKSEESPLTPKGETEEAKVEEPVKEEPKVEPVADEPKTQTPEPKTESTVRGNIATRSDFERPKSLNDALGKMISLGLNDRIAFEKNLFSGSADDLNRVLSQLNTINNYAEAKDFIDNLVKPDYNNWEGKEEYEERFMAIVEKKFD